MLTAGARPVLVEGPLDALAITLAGNGRYVGLAPLGTALTDPQADLLRPYLGPGRPGVIVATDADPAGHAAATRAYHHLTTRGDRPDYLPLPDGLDPADLLHQSGPTALRDALDHPTDLATHLIDQRLDTCTDTLQFAEGRVHAARIAAPLITVLPPTEWMPLIEHVATRTGLPPIAVGLMTFDAGQSTNADVSITRSTRPKDSQRRKTTHPMPRTIMRNSTAVRSAIRK